MSVSRKSRAFGTTMKVGVPSMDLVLNDQTFKVRGAMSGMKLINVIRAMDGDDEGAAADVMYQFIESAFLKEDRERAMDYLENAEPEIDMAELQNILQWLIGEYTGNPTQAPENSSASSPSDGSSSTAPVSEEAWISPIQTETDTTSSPSLPASPAITF